uniref:NADH-ubiquinone oxidoreductase chain 3 n=1 Tax=Gruberia lanceolata TaxID=1978530 RepID=A0A6C0UAJ1_9CILI|nr:NADH dehydrogenase subunit 3 [Gruberia lanceolata]
MGSVAIFTTIISMSIFGIGLYAGSLIYSYFFSKQGRNLLYRDFYECGFRAVPDNRVVLDLHFSIVGLIFLIYEMEIILFVPIFLNIKNITFVLFLILFFSIVILALSYWYEWERYALNWSF